MSQQGGGSGRPPPGGPPWPPQGQWPQQPQQQPHYQQPPQGQWPQPQPPYQQQPPQGQWPQPPHQQQRPPTQPPAGGASLGTALSRAFRLRIDPSEVTDHERDKLHAAGITSPVVQAFLAWRRSVLLVAAIGILGVLAFRFYDMSKQEGDPETLKMLHTLQTVVDVAFALLLWSQIGRWTRWRKQRRVLVVGWLLYFLMPFAIWLYPLRNALDDALAQQAAGDPQAQAAAAVMGPLLGIVASFGAMIELGPRAVSLMPGLLRGAITSKLLFPGASGPGWLVLLVAPVYAMVVYVVLIVPYQVTASGYFVVAMIGLTGAQLWMARMGYKLARPERLDEALALIKRIRSTYFLLSLAGMTFAAIGLYQLFNQLELPYVGIAKILINIEVGVLLLTLVATDLVVANLARGQMLMAEPGTQQAFATFQRDVSQFADPVVSSQQPR